ncbi:hypothetical protein JJB07_06530 [Tumebacillus sp. ITR2]|uniref:Uncharacterized protein n=1 Tax=Tumebacillus amylolyticus TaxID=2801339 RepID=A0ABS1J7T4_9BACL|nr:hypothetical protein [Tumebacillus amylolyticus]MBL0386309.1 hypothetical protein [Tumebacillus amylolyticus]
MAKAIGIFLCFALIGAYEFPRIWHRKKKYDLWMYGGLFLVSVTYCMLYVLDVPLPDPNSLVRLVFGGIGEKLMTPGT